MNYANATLVKTRIREALRYRLLTITTGNGFLCNIGDVYNDPPAELGTSANYPFVVPLWEYSRFFVESNSDIAFEGVIMLYVRIQNQSDVSLAVEKIEADISALLGAEPYLRDSTGVETCQRARVDSSVPFGMAGQKPAAGVRIGVRVWWGHRTDDPSVIGSVL